MKEAKSRKSIKQRMGGLALLLCLLLASCSDGNGDTVQTSNETDTTTQQSQTAEIDENNVLTLFEKEDFDAKVFRVICANTFNSSIVVRQAPDDTENGDKVNDSLIRRDMMIEEYFNTDIQYEICADDAEAGTFFKNAVLAGEDNWDLSLASMANVAYPMALEGLLCNLNDFEEIDFSSAWWNKYTLNDLCINDKIYMATGDITNRSVTAISGYVFNKKLFADYDIAEPYQAVYDGSWTMDVMYEIYKGQAQDLNSDGKLTLAEDFIPLMTGGYINYFVAGGRIIEKNQNGILELVHQKPENVDLMTKVMQFYAGDDVQFNAGYDGVTTFIENRSLLMYVAGCDLTLLRDMETDYGFVPFPKFDEAQEDYINPANYWIATCVMVPMTASEENHHFIGTITEALAAVSRYTSIVAQYDELMLEKLLRDEDSKNMAQICAETMSFDLGKLSNIATIPAIIEDSFVLNKEFTSKYESVETKAEEELAKIMEALG